MALYFAKVQFFRRTILSDHNLLDPFMQHIKMVKNLIDRFGLVIRRSC